jgi:hypothetical protein
MTRRIKTVFYMWAFGPFRPILSFFLFFKKKKKKKAYYIRAICVNLKDRRWKLLEQMSSSLTNSFLFLFLEQTYQFINMPCHSQISELVTVSLEFYNWVGDKMRFQHSLESCCTIIQLGDLMMPWQLAIMGNLMCESGVPPLEVLDGLINSFEGCDSSPAYESTQFIKWPYTCNNDQSKEN